MLNELLGIDLFWVVILACYVIVIIYLTKSLYSWMISHVYKREIAVYYNRKIIHIFAGGFVVLVVPFVFHSPWYPLLAGVLLGIITFSAHKSGKLFYWFQTKSDLNDVSFCIMWGVAIFVLWQFLGNKWIAIIPPAFIAFGDGITGIIRNLAFHERKKHPIGNVYMMGVCIPIGYFFANMVGLAVWGVLAAVAASFFERYEFGFIDDNILITVSATVILFVGGHIGLMI